MITTAIQFLKYWSSPRLHNRNNNYIFLLMIIPAIIFPAYVFLLHLFSLVFIVYKCYNPFVGVTQYHHVLSLSLKPGLTEMPPRSAFCCQSTPGQTGVCGLGVDVRSGCWKLRIPIPPETAYFVFFFLRNLTSYKISVVSKQRNQIFRVTYGAC